MSKQKESYECGICGKTFVRSQDVVQGALVRKTIAEYIYRDHPAWSNEGYICQSDLSKYRSKYVHFLLESEKGELSNIENEVLESLKKHELISSNIDAGFEQERSFGQMLADKIATFGGSWSFLIIFAAFITTWIVINSLVLFWRPVDPYPFILLNLLLSCLAAIQAPVIMMSQNRQEVKDRIRSEHDYQVNLKAELEIRLLHEKLDHILSKQWERLAQIQEIQLELLSELKVKRR